MRARILRREPNCAPLSRVCISYEQLLAILGQPRFGDRLERVAFNALPATFKPDMWAHQYDQQVNQVEASINEHRNWTTNGPDSNIFGLEPNFGCCTANMHQGWPKFAPHLWMATRDGGLAAVAYAPSRVRAVVAGNIEVSITSETTYPFGDRIRMQVGPSEPASFPLKLRIPHWARNATVTVNGQPAGDPVAESFHTIERIWERGGLGRAGPAHAARCGATLAQWHRVNERAARFLAGHRGGLAAGRRRGAPRRLGSVSAESVEFRPGTRPRGSRFGRIG